MPFTIYTSLSSIGYRPSFYLQKNLDFEQKILLNFAGYHPDALYKVGERQICAKFNRLVCYQLDGHIRRSRMTGEVVVVDHICSYVLHCTGFLCGKRYLMKPLRAFYYVKHLFSGIVPRFICPDLLTVPPATLPLLLTGDSLPLSKEWSHLKLS